MRSATVLIPISVGAVVLAVLGLAIAFPLTASATPANDDFPGAAITSLPFTETTDTTGATVQLDEPASSCNGALDSSVWWQFIPTETARYKLTVTGDGTWGPLFAVWGPSSFPGGGLSEVTCGGSLLFPDDEFPPPDVNEVAFQGDAGQTYYLQVGGFSFFGPEIKGSGPVAIALEQSVAPANDHIGNAITVGSLPFEDEQELAGATRELGEPSPSCVRVPFGFPIDLILDSTVWYEYTATSTGDVAVEALLAEGYYTEAAVWTGQPGNLAEVACGGPIGFTAEAGQTYYIQVGALNYAGNTIFPVGEVEIEIEALYHATCPGPTQQFVDATSDAFNYDYDLGHNVPAPNSRSDVTRVTVGAGKEWACITFEFAKMITGGNDDFADPVTVVAFLDLDRSISTGYTTPLSDFPDCTTPNIGAEVTIYATTGRNKLASVYLDPWGSANSSGGLEYAWQTSDEHSISVIVPIEDIGGDLDMNVAALAYDLEGEDCVPDHALRANAERVFVWAKKKPLAGGRCDSVAPVFRDPRASVVLRSVSQQLVSRS